MYNINNKAFGIDWSNPPEIRFPALRSNILAQQISELQHDQERTLNAIAESREEQENRVEERHQELISKLDETNSILMERLDATNDTLDFILNSIGANAQRIERQQLLTNDLFLELCNIMKTKDKSNLKSFLQNHSLEGIGLLLEFVSLGLGSK